MTATSKDKATGAVSPDQIIEDIGGCGSFQVRMSVVVHLIKTIVCFTFTGMIIISASPSWWCQDDVIANNLTSCLLYQNGSILDLCQKKTCYRNETTCTSFNYDRSLTTIVSEFSLVCGRDFIPSTINSIQIAGTLVGNVASGQIADLIGRRPPFFTSIFIIMTFNLVGYFSTSWQMFAVARFFLGMGGGFFLTTQYCFLSEFSLARWRVWIVGFPSWPIQSCLFSLLAYLLHDWRYIQLMTALCAVPCFLAWFALPESFRWYIAHDKPEKAEHIIRSIAKFNKHDTFDIDKVLQKPEIPEDKRYTVLHLFKSRHLVKVTLLLALSWIALGVVSYGISFGIQSLSGNIYLNVFLFSLTGIPGKSVALWLQNRFGRRAASIICFVIVAVGGLIVGIAQTFGNNLLSSCATSIGMIVHEKNANTVNVDILADQNFSARLPHKDELTNGFAMIANMGISMAWGPVQTITIELYPTVIRNIGFGTLSVTGRVGAILGPQLVYLNTYVPGLLYYVCAAISVTCVVGLLFLPETMNRNLNDKIQQGTAFTISDENIEVKYPNGYPKGNEKLEVMELTALQRESGHPVEKEVDTANVATQSEKINYVSDQECSIKL